MALLGNMVWLRESELPCSVASLTKRLTLRPIDYMTRQPKEVIEQYATRTHKGVLWYGLPVSYGLQVLQLDPELLPVTDRRNDGNAVEFPINIEPRNEAQREFFNGLVREAHDTGTFLAQAATGFGKTASAFYLMGQLKRKALVVVTNKSLAAQWAKEAVKFGMPKSAIGLYHGTEKKTDACVVIAVINSVVKMPKDVCDTFGTVVWDEAHRLGARVFSQTLQKFSSRYRIGLTATPTRKDKMERIFLDYFGEPAVIADAAPPVGCRCYVVDFTPPPTFHRYASVCGGSAPRLINWLTKCDARNEDIALLTESVVREGKAVLIVSDRIEQLSTLYDKLTARGIKAGMFTGEKVSGSGRVKVTPAERERVKETADVILGTYGLVREAFDCPRLSVGIDASPRGEGVQLCGRIRREFEGKREAIWFTIRDVGNSTMERTLRGRLKQFESCGVRVMNYDWQ